jgi:hypothetical protein
MLSRAAQLFAFAIFLQEFVSLSLSLSLSSQESQISTLHKMPDPKDTTFYITHSFANFAEKV